MTWNEVGLGNKGEEADYVVVSRVIRILVMLSTQLGVKRSSQWVMDITILNIIMISLMTLTILCLCFPEL